jgi:uncharacterized membrane-anchored protein YhcB (DUF1043 family)
MMDLSAVAQWASTVFVGLGLIYTWYRNGKNAAKEMGNITTELKQIHTGLDDVKQGLKEHTQKIETMSQTCTRLCVTVETHEKEIERMRRG